MCDSIGNVPDCVLENAINWHNEVTGDSWTTDDKDHIDIQMRIETIVDLSRAMKIVGNAVVIGYEDV